MTEIKVPNKRNTTVTVNGIGYPCILSYRIDRRTLTRPVRELMSGEVALPTVLGTEYTVVLRAMSEWDIESSAEGADIRVTTPRTVSVYRDCILIGTKEEMGEKGEYIRKYIFKTNRMEKYDLRGESD